MESLYYIPETNITNRILYTNYTTNKKLTLEVETNNFIFSI